MCNLCQLGPFLAGLVTYAYYACYGSYGYIWIDKHSKGYQWCIDM